MSARRDTDYGLLLVRVGVAVFTIALALARAGMDSAAVWIMPRLESPRLRATLAARLPTHCARR